MIITSDYGCAPRIYLPNVIFHIDNFTVKQENAISVLFILYSRGASSVDNGRNWIFSAECMQRYIWGKKKIQFPHTHTHNVGKVKVLRWRRSLACCVSDSELRREISLWGDFLDWSTQPSSSVRCRAPWSGLQRRTHLWQNCRTKTDQFKQMFKSFSVILAQKWCASLVQRSHNNF